MIRFSKMWSTIFVTTVDHHKTSVNATLKLATLLQDSVSQDSVAGFTLITNLLLPSAGYPRDTLQDGGIALKGVSYI